MVITLHKHTETTMKFPDDIVSLKERVEKILDPITSTIEKGTNAKKDFLFTAARTDSGRDLSPYYLVYFLFVDLLGYKNLGRFEKIAWSVPIDYKGTVYLLEHRKLGMGLFASDKESQEAECQEIVKKISMAVKVAQPYFEWIANEAAKRSNLNVLNHSIRLNERYVFLINEYKEKIQEGEFSKG